MALTFLTNVGSSSHAKYFDIRLDESYVVFRGNEDEAASAHLSGTLVLCLSEPLTIKHLKLTLIGMSRVCWSLPPATSSATRRPSREQVFYEKQWIFRDAGKGKTETWPADNYEFPFDVVLDGSLPESVEGLRDTWVTYRFKAQIGRKYARNIVVRKPLRIIRTLNPSALELVHGMIVENTWSNKIEYSISTPNKAVIFGTTVRVDFRLVPLLKGLEIGEIMSQLVECHDLTLNPEHPNVPGSTYKASKVIVSDNHELDQEKDLQIIDESAEGYRFSRNLDLPKTLKNCLQDTDTRGIKIRHKLRFRVQLHNPDGHISELRATLPVTVFISPNIPLDEDNNLVDQRPPSAQRASNDLTQQAPPLYGEHQFDQLYSEVDISGYITPGNASVPGTPFGSLSRNLSSDNVASMNALTNRDISASALHRRLSHLHSTDVNGAATPTEAGNRRDGESGHRLAERSTDYFQTSRGTSHSPDSDSAPQSRRVSEDHGSDSSSSGIMTPYPQFLEVETLSRVPSYDTAVRSTARTPLSSDLPDYRSATADDITTTGRTTSGTPQHPQPTHVRRSLRAHFSSSLADSYRPSIFHNRYSSQDTHEDEERQLRLAQARARG